jgi:hypothetical protein
VSLLLLAISYAAVAALLLNLGLATRHARWIKAGGVMVVTGLYVLSWYGLQGMLGWATPEALPAEFRVLWITTDEPDKQTGADGSIFFWVRTLDEAGIPVGEPRAHRVEWSEESAESAQEALDRMEEGELLNGRLGRSLMSERQQEEGGADYAGEQSVSGSGGLRPEFEFVRAPPPALPPKTVPE